MAETTPDWYDENEVIWLGINDSLKKAAYKRKVDERASYLIRQVQVSSPQRPRLFTPNELWALADRADHEFSVLGQFSIKVPEVKWHVAERAGRAAALVARVAIVEGVGLLNLRQHPDYRHYVARIGAYKALCPEGGDLDDVSVKQCMVGHMRIQPGPDELMMVDVDPLFD